MPIFEQGDVIRVPFPYTDRDTRQRRPALVVSNGSTGEENALLWVVMITSAENRQWAGDVQIKDHTKAGLPAPSVIRPVKIATIEARHAEPIGKVTAPARRAVMQYIKAIISAE
ncbi:MAG: type II toxin-antitoxin system PemK/MazF family toxin [Methylovirgula sp.]